ncbi:MAG: nucleobase:cation symporter-2 family protein [Propionibacteriaceae bacterium]|nr:nucleobase:cation symporter-2 family protein [Propionibacteriaceae bacterium]
MSSTPQVHPVDEVSAAPKLFALGLQHVLVMYAGAIAVPLIVGRALQLSSTDVAFLISADLFVCGIVTILQSFGATQWFGIRLPVMMGVTFAAVGPMVAIATANPGTEGARQLFGSVMAAGVVAMLIAPLMSRLLRFFPPVVTGTIILVIGISLMRIGINWIFGNPTGPTAPTIVDPAHSRWLSTVDDLSSAPGSAIPMIPPGLRAAPSLPNPLYATLGDLAISAAVLVAIVVVARFGKGFLANVSVLLGIVFGSGIAAAAGKVSFTRVIEADWFALVMPFHFGTPLFDPVMVVTMSLVMIVVMIESTGMFLALGDLTGRPVTRRMLSAGLRTDGLGTLIGGLFNTFPYTSISQNVGLVGVTGVRSRFVCVAGGGILIVLGLVPKMSAMVEALPTSVLGGAGIAMFGMVAATGIRILSGVDFAANRNSLLVVAISLGIGMIPLVAPDFSQWMPAVLHPLIESGILLATFSAVVLNAFLNGTADDPAATRRAAVLSDH